jgi:hypothetical protein
MNDEGKQPHRDGAQTMTSYFLAIVIKHNLIYCMKLDTSPENQRDHTPS